MVLLATCFAYGGNSEFRRVVTLDGALFEESGAMSGGGGKPRGGRMGTSIRATGLSGEVVTNTEKELSQIVDLLSDVPEKIGKTSLSSGAGTGEKPKRVETEGCRSELTHIRAELEPWKKELCTGENFMLHHMKANS